MDLTSTGDAIVSALQVLHAVNETGQDLATLTKGMQKLPQVMINVSVPDPKQTAQSDALNKAIQGKKSLLADRGRILVRPSGTEPLLRVMVEGEEAGEVREIAQELAYVAENDA